MMYLTRVKVDAGQCARFRIGDPYRWHQEIWKAFPGIPENSPQNYLYRVDHQNNGITVVWILSPDIPHPPEWGIWEIKEVAASFLQHKRYQFALSANPTIMRVVRLDNGTRKKNGRRTTIYSDEELRQWLLRKGEVAGFHTDELRCEPPVKEYFYKNKKQGVHARVDFSGILTVTDPVAFENAWKNGIGPAKAFGFGLLLLRPID